MNITRLISPQASYGSLAAFSGSMNASCATFSWRQFYPSQLLSWSEAATCRQLNFEIEVDAKRMKNRDHGFKDESLLNYIRWFKLAHLDINNNWTLLTYGPRKAVAEVSNHNEPIGRKSGIELVRKIRRSMGFTFSCFVLNWLTD